jgi:hypothetical protein
VLENTPLPDEKPQKEGASQKCRDDANRKLNRRQNGPSNRIASNQERSTKDHRHRKQDPMVASDH